MNKKFTGEEVQQAALAANLTNIPFRDCSMCNTTLHYKVRGGSLFFDSNCGCTTMWSPMEPRSWAYAADAINMQTNDTARSSIAAKFGIWDAV